MAIGVLDRTDVLNVYARLWFARGTEVVSLTWSAAGSLLGLANENPELDQDRTEFRAAPDGSFVAYHFGTRCAVRLRFTTGNLSVVRCDDGVPLDARRIDP